RVSRLSRPQHRGRAAPWRRHHHHARPRAHRPRHIGSLALDLRLDSRCAQQRRSSRHHDGRGPGRHCHRAPGHPRSGALPPGTEKLHDFDRRWIFLAMGLAVVLPLLFPIDLPIKASPMVKSLYYTVEELEEGDVVFVGLDLDPASTPELEPFYRAVVLQLKRK